jgi:hypothetical protein
MMWTILNLKVLRKFLWKPPLPSCIRIVRKVQKMRANLYYALK